MAALRDMILWGWSEEKCLKCRRNYEEDNKRPMCETENKCAITRHEPINLNFEEMLLLDDIDDFMATGQIMTTDRDRRRSIRRLAGYCMGLQQEISSGTRRR